MTTTIAVAGKGGVVKFTLDKIVAGGNLKTCSVQPKYQFPD